MTAALVLLVAMAAADPVTPFGAAKATRPQDAAPEEEAAPAPPVTAGDIVQIVLPASVWAGSELWITGDPADCRWCDLDAQGRDTLNGFDRGARDWLVSADADHPVSARTSDVLWYGMLLPASIVYPALASGDSGVEALRMTLWSHALTSLATQTTKRITRRARPSTHFGTTEAETSGANTSFFSGHTSGAFAAVFTTVQTCRLTGCGGERWAWLLGLPAASAVGVLRIRADRHYATDVLAGAAAGATIGWFTPKLARALDPPAGSPSLRPRVAISATGAALAWTW